MHTFSMSGASGGASGKATTVFVGIAKRHVAPSVLSRVRVRSRSVLCILRHASGPNVRNRSPGRLLVTWQTMSTSTFQTNIF